MSSRWFHFGTEIVKGLLKNEVLELAAGSRRQPPEPPAATGNGVRPAAQSHLSTRAGGQDDVSSYKLPQISTCNLPKSV